MERPEPHKRMDGWDGGHCLVGPKAHQQPSTSAGECSRVPLGYVVRGGRQGLGDKAAWWNVCLRWKTVRQLPGSALTTVLTQQAAAAQLQSVVCTRHVQRCCANLHMYLAQTQQLALFHGGMLSSSTSAVHQHTPVTQRRSISWWQRSIAPLYPALRKGGVARAAESEASPAKGPQPALVGEEEDGPELLRPEFEDLSDEQVGTCGCCHHCSCRRHCRAQMMLPASCSYAP